MSAILFTHGQTLYTKVTIPVALELLDRGHQVTIRVNRPVLFGRSLGFSQETIKSRPTTVGVVNPEALDFVADLIGLGERWFRGSDQFASEAIETLGYDQHWRRRRCVDWNSDCVESSSCQPPGR